MKIAGLMPMNSISRRAGSNKGNRIPSVKESFSIGKTAKLRRNENSRSLHIKAARERSRLILLGVYNENEEKKLCEKYCLYQFS